MTNIIAGTGIVGSLEEKVKAIVEFASDPKNKVILFMDEIHQITGGTSSHGDPTGRKISQILKPALARGEMCSHRGDHVDRVPGLRRGPGLRPALHPADRR